MCPAPVPLVAWLDDVQERDKSPACHCYCSTSTTATTEVRQSRWISRCVLEKFFRSECANEFRCKAEFQKCFFKSVYFMELCRFRVPLKHGRIAKFESNPRCKTPEVPLKFPTDSSKQLLS
jgi:hypothetical protein